MADYLQSLGYTPVKQQGRNLWYKSPLREETDASFKVNTELNKWYDFGLGKGGNIIALAAELYRSEDVAYLLKRIEERTPYIRPASFSFGRQHSDNQPYQVLRGWTNCHSSCSHCLSARKGHKHRLAKSAM